MDNLQRGENIFELYIWWDATVRIYKASQNLISTMATQ